MSFIAVIFDLGGVLVRTQEHKPRQRLASRLGMSNSALNDLIFESDSAQMATRGLITTKDHWESIRASLGLSGDEFYLVKKDFWSGDVLDLFLVDYIRSLRPQYKTALLSNAWDNLRQVLQDHLRIQDAFDEIVISAEVGVAKPDSRIYQITLERLGVDPPEAIFVDDFLENVEAARQLGIHAIHFQNPTQGMAEIDTALGRE